MAQRNWTTIKEYGDIRFELYNGIAKITITRPHVYNAFRPETNMDMLDAMEIARERQDVRVVVFTGEGEKAFCSGGDQNVKGTGGYIGGDGVAPMATVYILIAFSAANFAASKGATLPALIAPSVSSIKVLDSLGRSIKRFIDRSFHVPVSSKSGFN